MALSQQDLNYLQSLKDKGYSKEEAIAKLKSIKQSLSQTKATGEQKPGILTGAKEEATETLGTIGSVAKETINLGKDLFVRPFTEGLDAPVKSTYGKAILESAKEEDPLITGALAIPRMAKEAAVRIGKPTVETAKLVPKAIENVGRSAIVGGKELVGIDVSEEEKMKQQEAKEAVKEQAAEVSKSLGEALEIMTINPLSQAVAGVAKEVGEGVKEGKTGQEITGRSLVGGARQATFVGLLNKILPGAKTDKIDDLAGAVAQGTKKDIKKLKNIVDEIDVSAVNTYDDLSNQLTKNIENKINDVDNIYLQDKNLYKPNDLVKKTEVGETTVKQDYVNRALDELKTVYENAGDDIRAEKINQLKTRFENEGLELNEINKIARIHGQDVSNKGFNAKGEPLTSINKIKFENTRSGVKEVSRNKLEDEAAKVFDKNISDMLRIKTLADKTIETVNGLKQKIDNLGIIEKISGKTAELLNLSLGGAPKAFISKFFPSNMGYKRLNSLQIEKKLNSNLTKLQKLLKLENSNELVDQINKFIRKNRIELGITAKGRESNQKK